MSYLHCFVFFLKSGEKVDENVCEEEGVDASVENDVAYSWSVDESSSIRNENGRVDEEDSDNHVPDFLELRVRHYKPLRFLKFSLSFLSFFVLIWPLGCSVEVDLRVQLSELLQDSRTSPGFQVHSVPEEP